MRVYHLVLRFSVITVSMAFPRGVMIPPSDAITAEGYDLKFGVNVVGQLSFSRPEVHAIDDPGRTLLLYASTPSAAGGGRLFQDCQSQFAWPYTS